MSAKQTLEQRLLLLYRIFEEQRVRPGASEPAAFVAVMKRWTKMVIQEAMDEESFWRNKEERDKARFDY